MEDLLQAKIVALYEGLFSCVIPPLLIFALRYLQQIAQRLGQISVSLAVVVERIESHERRVTRLETMVEKRFHEPHVLK